MFKAAILILFLVSQVSYGQKCRVALTIVGQQPPFLDQKSRIADFPYPLSNAQIAVIRVEIPRLEVPASPSWEQFKVEWELTESEIPFTPRLDGNPELQRGAYLGYQKRELAKRKRFLAAVLAYDQTLKLLKETGLESAIAETFSALEADKLKRTLAVIELGYQGRYQRVSPGFFTRDRVALKAVVGLFVAGQKALGADGISPALPGKLTFGQLADWNKTTAEKFQIAYATGTTTRMMVEFKSRNLGFGGIPIDLEKQPEQEFTIGLELSIRLEQGNPEPPFCCYVGTNGFCVSCPNLIPHLKAEAKIRANADFIAVFKASPANQPLKGFLAHHDPERAPGWRKSTAAENVGRITYREILQPLLFAKVFKELPPYLEKAADLGQVEKILTFLFKLLHGWSYYDRYEEKFVLLVGVMEKAASFWAAGTVTFSELQALCDRARPTDSSVVLWRSAWNHTLAWTISRATKVSLDNFRLEIGGDDPAAVIAASAKQLLESPNPNADWVALLLTEDSRDSRTILPILALANRERVYLQLTREQKAKLQARVGGANRYYPASETFSLKFRAASNFVTPLGFLSSYQLILLF